MDNGDGTGSFDWTPTFVQSGTYPVTFYATDDSLAVDSEQVTITVTEPGNQAPVLAAIGAKLTTLSQEQADYIGVPVEGPYKPDHYRY